MTRRASGTFITGTDLTENDALVLLDSTNHRSVSSSHALTEAKGPCYRGMLAELENDSEDELTKLKRMVKTTRKKLDSNMEQLKNWRSDVDLLKRDMSRAGNNGGSAPKNSQKALQDGNQGLYPGDLKKRKSLANVTKSSLMMLEDKRRLKKVEDIEPEHSSGPVSQFALLKARNSSVKVIGPSGPSSSSRGHNSIGNIIVDGLSNPTLNLPIPATPTLNTSSKTTNLLSEPVSGVGGSRLLNSGSIEIRNVHPGGKGNPNADGNASNTKTPTLGKATYNIKIHDTGDSCSPTSKLRIFNSSGKNRTRRSLSMGNVNSGMNSSMTSFSNPVLSSAIQTSMQVLNGTNGTENATDRSVRSGCTYVANTSNRSAESSVANVNHSSNSSSVEELIHEDELLGDHGNISKSKTGGFRIGNAFHNVVSTDDIPDGDVDAIMNCTNGKRRVLLEDPADDFEHESFVEGGKSGGAFELKEVSIESGLPSQKAFINDEGAEKEKPPTPAIPETHAGQKDVHRDAYASTDVDRDGYVSGQKRNENSSSSPKSPKRLNRESESHLVEVYASGHKKTTYPMAIQQISPKQEEDTKIDTSGGGTANDISAREKDEDRDKDGLFDNSILRNSADISGMTNNTDTDHDRIPNDTGTANFPILIGDSLSNTTLDFGKFGLSSPNNNPRLLSQRYTSMGSAIGPNHFLTAKRDISPSKSLVGSSSMVKNGDLKLSNNTIAGDSIPDASNLSNNIKTVGNVGGSIDKPKRACLERSFSGTDLWKPKRPITRIAPVARKSTSRLERLKELF